MDFPAWLGLYPAHIPAVSRGGIPLINAGECGEEEEADSDSAWYAQRNGEPKQTGPHGCAWDVTNTKLLKELI